MAAPNGDGGHASRQIEAGERPGEQRRVERQAVFEQRNLAPSKAFRIDCTRRRNDALDVFGELCLRPHYAIDGKCSRNRSPSPSGVRRSSRDTTRNACGEPSRVAINEASTLTSSIPVADTRTSQRSTPASFGALWLVPLPRRNCTSRVLKRSATAGFWSTTTSSCRDASRRPSPQPDLAPANDHRRMVVEHAHGHFRCCEYPVQLQAIPVSRSHTPHQAYFRIGRRATPSGRRLPSSHARTARSDHASQAPPRDRPAPDERRRLDLPAASHAG
jgi:hypothetical protein